LLWVGDGCSTSSAGLASCSRRVRGGISLPPLAAVLQSTDRFAMGRRRLAAVWGLGRLRPARYR
jgi:hypothetical protein